MRRSLLAVPLCLALAAAPALALVPVAGAAPAAAVTVTKTTLHFAVVVGPQDNLPCDIEADLYVPSSATAAAPAPAILTSNGFGGSKDSTGGTASNATYADFFSKQGYVALSYSGLGFGGSGGGEGCKIQLDDPDTDGKAGRFLVDFLGGKAGGVFTDAAHTIPVTARPPVVLDTLDHGATPAFAANDPRVGMIGGSYGGENQFAVAGMDPRVDTIVPQITWNDLSYSLAPNNLGLSTDVTQNAARPGVEKIDWTTLFFAVGAAQPVTSPAGSPVTGSTCPGFDSRACTAKAQMDALGYPTADTITFAQHASVVSYLDRIRIPVFLSQGQHDTLFNLQEASATYRGLKARDVPVKMLWQKWGHSGGAVPGEADATKPLGSTFDDLRYAAWFDKWLRGNGAADTGPEFEYYADFLPRVGTGPNDEQHLGGSSYPVGTRSDLFLSGAGALVGTPAQVTAGSAMFAASQSTTTSYSETSAVDQSLAVRDDAGTFAAFTSPPLTANADVVGPPRLTVRLSAPSFAVSQAQPAGQLVLFAKLYDVAPDGSIVLKNRLISPVRVADVTKPVSVDLPAIVERFEVGHRFRLVLAAGDMAYKGNDAAGPVTVVNDPAAPNRLSVPLTNAEGAAFGAAADPGPAAVVPEAPLAALLPLVALGVAGLLVLRRRRRA